MSLSHPGPPDSSDNRVESLCAMLDGALHAAGARSRPDSPWTCVPVLEEVLSGMPSALGLDCATFGGRRVCVTLHVSACAWV